MRSSSDFRAQETDDLAALRLLPLVKRVRERWLADAAFREMLTADPATLAAEYPQLDAAGLRFLWHPCAPADRPEGRAFAALGAWIGEYLAFCHDPAALSGSDPRYGAWRARQVARSAFELGIVAAGANLHLPFAVELSRGCSVGCWFCGLSAGRLGGTMSAASEGMQLWDECLKALHRPFGAFARRGLLFWATDPLDHPDYERFADAFADRLGGWPSTTTAIPLRDLDRTRRLVARARERGTPRMRFSVLTVRALAQLHAAFTPAELADIDLVPVNKGSLLALAVAGRLRGDDGTRPARAAAEQAKLIGGVPSAVADAARHETIACVSGFLIDMVGRRVRLVSPVRASPAWPDGYVMLDERPFATGAALAEAIEAMMAGHMLLELQPDTVLHLPPDLDVQLRADGLTVTARGHELTFSRRARSGHLAALLASFAQGRSVDSAVRDPGLAAVPRNTLLRDITAFWQAGVLVERAFVTRIAEPAA